MAKAIDLPVAEVQEDEDPVTNVIGAEAPVRVALPFIRTIQKNATTLWQSPASILPTARGVERKWPEASQKQLETEKQKIVAEFQQLRQFLEEQERLLLAQLEELNKEIEKGRAEYVAKLSEELSSFSSLISEMEQKCQQPASEFLQDIKGTLSSEL
ncbi:tripartite motif-containing protein 15-like [Mauremys mutica]|uniref:tripartite motif-containing protein 15-like n=1 Tax=Mauremys mutica TaxID=74926 RepID=UPI001D163014|nr:tripartite motif-containing protein 15-like [Mauremys mutica]